MATKLKLVLRTLRRTLASKRSWLLRGALFALLLGYAVHGQFSGLSVTVLILGSLILYSQPVFQTVPYFIPFVLLLSLAILSFYFFGEAELTPYLLIFFGWLFFMLLGVKNVAFVSRQNWFLAFELLTLYLSAAIFFAIDKTQHIFLPSLSLLIVIFVLARQFFRLTEMRGRRLIALVSLAIALMVVELTWVLSIASVGFWPAAGLVAAYFFVLQEVSRHYLASTLKSKTLLQYFSVFALLTILASIIS